MVLEKGFTVSLLASAESACLSVIMDIPKILLVIASAPTNVIRPILGVQPDMNAARAVFLVFWLREEQEKNSLGHLEIQSAILSARKLSSILPNLFLPAAECASLAKSTTKFTMKAENSELIAPTLAAQFQQCEGRVVLAGMADASKN